MHWDSTLLPSYFAQLGFCTASSRTRWENPRGVLSQMVWPAKVTGVTLLHYSWTEVSVSQLGCVCIFSFYFLDPAVLITSAE